MPPEWQAALGGPVLNGNCCLPIIGRTSFGPSVFTYDPVAIGTVAQLEANALIYYWTDHPLTEDSVEASDACFSNSTLFNCATQVRGVVFPRDTRSVLFFGRQGLGGTPGITSPATGGFCYGEGTSDPALDGTPVPSDPEVVYCYDPAISSKGSHAWPYAHYVWAYDANDLASVKSGELAPWDVKPYAVWRLEFPFDTTFGTPGDASNRQIGGATYDPLTNRIFVSQMFGDDQRPVIHVYAVQTP